METTELQPVNAELMPATIDPDDDITVVASSQAQMESALKALSLKMEHRLTKLRAELADFERNLEIAKKNKLKQTTIVASIYKTRRRVEFYEKLKAAFDAGFVPIPDMDLDIFAVRTTRRKPKENTRTGSADWGGPRVPDQESNRPPLGEGVYVDVQAFNQSRHFEKTETTPSGQHVTKKMIQRWASEFDEELNFPFVLAKPRILEATATALSHKIFDEVGVLPNRRRRHGDPMVVGRVTLKEGWRRRNISFLITWFIDTREL